MLSVNVNRLLYILLNPFLKVIRAVSRRYDAKCKKLSDSNIQKTSDLFGKKHGDLTQYVTHVTDSKLHCEK